jgi:glucosamine kinase
LVALVKTPAIRIGSGALTGMSRENKMSDKAEPLLLGIDGGGTQCRARLSDASGATLAEAVAGPANIRLGMEESFAAVFQAGARCLEQAGLAADLDRVVACFALAGASEPGCRAAAQRHAHPYHHAVVTTDAQAACVGAHGGRDGGIMVVGTGSIGWAAVAGRHIRIGGWGLAVSDEGSGAWLGREALRRVLWAHDGRIAWTGLLNELFLKFQSDPHAIGHWAFAAKPRELAAIAPVIVGRSGEGDPAAVDLMSMAAGHIDALAARLLAVGVHRLAIVGGLAGPVEPWLAGETRRHLVRPAGDALDGALRLAGAAAGIRAADAHLLAPEDEG